MAGDLTMNSEKNVLAARREVEEKLVLLETFSFDTFSDDEINTLAGLMSTFHPGSETRARHATKVQIERARQTIHKLLGYALRIIIEEVEGSERAGHFIYSELGLFLTSIHKWHHSRTEQSRSGKRTFSLENAQLREENLRLKAELEASREVAAS
jgi:hypothetical protein